MGVQLSEMAFKYSSSTDAQNARMAFGGDYNKYKTTTIRNSIMSNPIKDNNETYFQEKKVAYEEAKFKYDELVNKLSGKKELTESDKSKLEELRFDMDYKFSLKTDAGLRLRG